MTAADDYLRSVSFELGDLPWDQRQELLAEIRTHLDELPAGTDLEARLGTPKKYAADLRAAAGLERRHGARAFLLARRPRTLVLIVVALTVIGLAIGAVVWIDSYQPLAFYSGEEPPLGVVEQPGGEMVVFRKGQPFRLGLDIKNTGGFTVRVLGVSYGPGRQLFTARLFMSAPMRHSGFPRPYRLFRPFDMKPGEVRVLELRGVYAHCRYWRGGGYHVVTDFLIQFRYLWRTSTADIPLPEPLAIVFPKGFRCFSRP